MGTCVQVHKGGGREGPTFRSLSLSARATKLCTPSTTVHTRSLAMVSAVQTSLQGLCGGRGKTRYGRSLLVVDHVSGGHTTEGHDIPPSPFPARVRDSVWYKSQEGGGLLPRHTTTHYLVYLLSRPPPQRSSQLYWVGVDLTLDSTRRLTVGVHNRNTTASADQVSLVGRI